MNSLKPILSVAFLVMFFGTQEIQAQWKFSNFAATNQAQAFAVIFTNGASAQYFLKYSVAMNGIISGRAVRYDIGKDSSSASPRSGTSLAIRSGQSGLGLPIKAYKDKLYETSPTTLRCPFSVKLSDGAIIKGAMERNIWPDGGFYGNSMKGMITYKGAVGSTLSLSNPY